MTIVEDLRCLNEPDAALAALHRFMAELEVIYLTVDLDVLPASQMPAVSAPAALGVPAAMLMRMIEPICRSGKLRAADLVEFNPACDRDKQGASGGTYCGRLPTGGDKLLNNGLNWVYLDHPVKPS